MIGDGFYIGEIIWGKVRGYPPWPAKILESIGKRKYKIVFFGEQSYATVSKENLFHFNAKSTQTKNKKLQMAINEARAEMEYKEEEEEMLMTDNTFANVTKEKKPNFKILLRNNSGEPIIQEEEEENDKENIGDESENESNGLCSPIIQLDELYSVGDREPMCFLSQKTQRSEMSSSPIEEEIIQQMINYLLCFALEFQKRTRSSLNQEEESCLTKIFNYFSQGKQSPDALVSIKNGKMDILMQYILNKIKTKTLIVSGNAAYLNIQSQLLNQLINNN